MHNAESGITHVVCGGFPSGCNDASANLLNKQRQRLFHYSYRTNQSGILVINRSEILGPQAFPSDFGGYPDLLRLGQINDVVVNQNGVIAIELIDDIVRHIVVLNAGINNKWGYVTEDLTSAGGEEGEEGEELSLIHI